MKKIIVLLTILISFDYAHKHAEPDLLLTTVKYEIVKGVYVGIGYSVSVDSSFLNPNKIYSNTENISVGVSFIL